MLKITALHKNFGEQFHLKDISLDIAEGEFCALLGPSGCGKTTLLRLIAGLDLPDGGCISFQDKNITMLPAHQRNFNTVFQKYALFPHKNVFENVAFGLRMRKVPSQEIEIRVQNALDLVKMSGFEKRTIPTLSGGQSQRIAIARAIVNRPSILLLDEPLSALDLKLKESMQAELLSLQRTLKMTFIFVTHDQQEALSLADRIIVMNGGEIQQIGTPQEIYEHPKTEFVAEFIGSINKIPVIIKEKTDDYWIAHAPCAAKKTIFIHRRKEMQSEPNLTSPDLSIIAKKELHKPVHVLVRPEKLRILKNLPAEKNAIEITIKSAVYHGESTRIIGVVKTESPENTPLELTMSQWNTAMTLRKNFNIGDKAWAVWQPEDCFFINTDTGNTLS